MLIHNRNDIELLIFFNNSELLFLNLPPQMGFVDFFINFLYLNKMHINKIVFLSFLFFSNLSYSDNNNQQLLIKDPKKVETFLVKDINDVEKTISNAENKVLLLNFWATWCAPCIKEIPELIELKEKFKNNIEVYFFSVDFNVKKTVPKFLKKNKIEGLSVLNDEKLKVSDKFKIKVMPTTVVINKNFEEVAQVKGYVDWLSPEYINFIKKLL